jgi:HD-GYP domain-containing protein (c-di-GMP phosphodiesterase class II)
MNVLSRYRVPVQIAAGFFVGVILLAIVAAVGIGRVNVMRARANEAATLGGVSTLTRDVMARMLDQSSAVRGYVATGDPRYLDSTRQAELELSKDLATLHDVDQTNAVDSPRLEQIDIEAGQIESDIAAVKKTFAAQRQLVAAGRRSAALAEMSNEELAFQKLRRDDDALLNYTTAQAKVASEEFEQALVIVVAVLIGSTIAAVITLVLTALFVGGSIARRLASVTRALHDVTEDDLPALTAAFGRLSEGDLSARFKSEPSSIVDPGRDEIAQLAASYNGVVIGIGLISLAFDKMARELNRRQRLADETFRQTMTGIAAIVDKRDPYTAGHSRRVSEYAVKLARRMGLDESLTKTIEASALLHDLGKIGIPDAILLKPAKLDERQRAIIVTHPEIASEILGGIEAMYDIVPCILHHHERWDGSGYPSEMAGEEIPLGARVIAVADTYDAMTTDRPYRRALLPEDSRQELLRGAGVQWDARCVEAFVELIDAGLLGPPPPPANFEEWARAFGQQV